MKYLLLNLFVFTSFIVPSSTAFADVTMELSDGGLAHVSNGHVAFGTKGNYVLLEPGKDTFILVNNDDKTYMEVPQNFAQQMAATMSAQMEKAMADMPPGQREAFELTMKNMMPGQRPQVVKTPRRTGKKNTVAGFGCSEIEVSTPGRGVDEVICVASADELDISDGDYAALMGAMEAMAQMAQMGPGAPSMDFDKIGGIPIRTEGSNGRKISELVGLNNDSIPADRFDIPTGYREISIDSLMRPR